MAVGLIRGAESDSEPDVDGSGSGNTSPSEFGNGGGFSENGLVGLSGIAGGTAE